MIFKVEINDIKDKSYKDYINKFNESKNKYLVDMFRNNHNVMCIIFDKDEWDRIERILPYNMSEINDEIFIKEDFLCISNSAYINEIRNFLSESCDTKIVKEHDKIFLEPLGKFIDEIIVKFIKNRMSSISSNQFEFYEKGINYRQMDS